jgi:tripartite-type tricarboxylate transporter receptor subunit TctC
MRRAIGLLFLMLSLAHSAVCLAQGKAANWPSKPLRIVVAFPPGGATDLMARTIAGKLQERLGQPVVVENRPGASGMIGTDLVAKSAPDGYSLLMATQTTHAVNPSLYPKVSYDPVKDFAPITLAGYTPLMLVVPASLPVANLRQLIAWIKANPGRVSYGSGGNGTSQHLTGELFKSMAGVDMLHVPYKGSAPAMTDLLGGQITLMFDNLPTALPHVKSGRLRGIAVTSPVRSNLAPDVPTMAESGLPGFDVATWFGLLAPAGTPPEIVNRIQLATAAGLNEPSVRNKLSEQGIEIVVGTPAQFTAFLDVEIAKWGKVIRDSGAKAD